MSTIVSSAKGSGYHDIFLEDGVVRVTDNQLPTGYEPTAGDNISYAEDGMTLVLTQAPPAVGGHQE